MFCCLEGWPGFEPIKELENILFTEQETILDIWWVGSKNIPNGAKKFTVSSLVPPIIRLFTARELVFPFTIDITLIKNLTPGGLPEHPPGGGPAGRGLLKHLGNQVQDPRARPQPPLPPRPGIAHRLGNCWREKYTPCLKNSLTVFVHCLLQ